METPPGKVIRSLRQALDMTQAEFAHAAGWSTSTISSWERGTTQPSRLAFKTILAFAEERGVRYQPKADGAVTTTGNLPVLRLGSRLPAPPVTLDAEGSFPPGTAEREESFGSRRWTEVAASRPTVEIAARGASIAERPEWHVEARLQVRVGTSGERLRRTGYVAASLMALVIGVGAGAWLRSGVGSNTAPRTAERPPIQEPVSAPRAAKAPPVEVDELALTAFAVAPAAGPPLAADQPAEIAIAPVPAMPPPSYARLESIVSLDGIRRATFRMGDRSIALVEGDAIGRRAVGEIANSEVMLVGEGAPKRVRLGAEIPVD